jgi:hypothetical protein
LSAADTNGNIFFPERVFAAGVSDVMDSIDDQEAFP